MSKLTDRYNRNLNYLRVSITDRCNLKCMYCLPPGGNFRWLAHSEILRYEEILRIIRIGVGLGISKVRITGGEPLVRKGVYAFLEKLGQIPGIKDISLTTNGVLLEKNLERLKTAGIRRLNISLDTLDREKYKRITGHDAFKEVWAGIEKALKLGFHPIKINTVAMNGVNDDELTELALLAKSRPFHMRFIEYMPFTATEEEKRKRLLAPEIMEKIRRIAKLYPLKNTSFDGPAERFRAEGFAGEIGFIRPLSHHFCHKCNRLRLTASGCLRPCLLSDRQTDIKGPLRKGASDDEIVEIFLKAIRYKPMSHTLNSENRENIESVMSSIGG